VTASREQQRVGQDQADCRHELSQRSSSAASVANLNTSLITERQPTESLARPVIWTHTSASPEGDWLAQIGTEQACDELSERLDTL
jgi:hypothetical protein